MKREKDSKKLLEVRQKHNQQTKKNRESCGDIGSVATVTNSQVALVNTAALW